jgi:hypothetical protein
MLHCNMDHPSEQRHCTAVDDNNLPKHVKTRSDRATHRFAAAQSFLDYRNRRQSHSVPAGWRAG